MMHCAVRMHKAASAIVAPGRWRTIGSCPFLSCAAKGPLPFAAGSVGWHNDDEHIQNAAWLLAAVVLLLRCAVLCCTARGTRTWAYAVRCQAGRACDARSPRTRSTHVRCAAASRSTRSRGPAGRARRGWSPATRQGGWGAKGGKEGTRTHGISIAPCDCGGGGCWCRARSMRCPRQRSRFPRAPLVSMRWNTGGHMYGACSGASREGGS